MYWVYIIECADGTLYTGITKDVAARVSRHELGSGAKYVRGRGPVKIVFRERKLTRSSAQKREAEVKSLSREKKLQLIRGG